MSNEAREILQDLLRDARSLVQVLSGNRSQLGRTLTSSLSLRPYEIGQCKMLAARFGADTQRDVRAASRHLVAL